MAETTDTLVPDEFYISLIPLRIGKDILTLTGFRTVFSSKMNTEIAANLDIPFKLVLGRIDRVPGIDVYQVAKDLSLERFGIKLRLEYRAPPGLVSSSRSDT